MHSAGWFAKIRFESTLVRTKSRIAPLINFVRATNRGIAALLRPASEPEAPPDGTRASVRAGPIVDHEDFAESDICSPMVRDFYRYWLGLTAKRPMPDQTDVDPTQIPRHVLPFINLTDVRPDGRFKSRLAGTKVVALSGLDITGRYIDEIPGTEDMLRQFQRLVRSRKPYHCIVPLTWSARALTWANGGLQATIGVATIVLGGVVINESLSGVLGG